MALLYIDGFDTCGSDVNSNRNLRKRYKSLYGTNISDATTDIGRFGSGRSLQLGSDTASVMIDLNKTIDTVTVGFAFKGGLPLWNRPLFRLWNANNQIVAWIYFESGSNTSVMTNVAGGNASIYGIPYTIGSGGLQWSYVEWKVGLTDPGIFEFRRNGIAYTTGVISANFGSGSAVTPNTIRYVELIRGSTGATSNWFDDLYITDTSGSTNTGFISGAKDGSVLPITLSADGVHRDMGRVGGGTSGVTLLTDQDPNYALSPTNSTGVRATGPNARESYQIGGISTSNTTVNGIQLYTNSSRNPNTLSNINHFVRIGSTNYDKPNIALPVSNYYQQTTMFEKNPATNNTWATSDLTGMEVGFRVT